MPYRFTDKLCVQDRVVDLLDLIPVLDVPSEQAMLLARQSFIPLTIAGDRQYLLSLRHGTLANRDALFKLLKGASSHSD